jgi:prepilin-type N-terminal cleavage/methylation domain-containing protein
MSMAERFRDQRGFTLTELMVTIAVLGLVMAGVIGIQQQGQQAYVMGSNRVETQQNARVALELMVRELRSAQSVTALGGATDITFVDGGGQTIRYEISGSTLNRTVGGTTTALIGGVQSLTMTYFSVYNVQTGTYTQTTNPATVTVVSVSLTTQTEESAASGSMAAQYAKMESVVGLRNLAL